MADKSQIRAHLAQSATIKLDNISEPTSADIAKKLQQMEHVEKSRGQA